MYVAIRCRHVCFLPCEMQCSFFADHCCALLCCGATSVCSESAATVFQKLFPERWRLRGWRMAERGNDNRNINIRISALCYRYDQHPGYFSIEQDDVRHSP